MKFSHKHKCIFIHVPKTAGSSIGKVLCKMNFGDLRSLYNHEGITNVTRPLKPSVRGSESGNFIITIPNHISCQELKSVLGKKYDNYFKFAFVRNPWDWSVSFYKYVRKARSHHYHEKYKKYKNFHEYIISTKDQCEQGDNRPRQQSDFIYSADGEPLVDYVGRFENLQEDFNLVCDKIGIPQQKLPHRNKTKQKHYTEYYDDETRTIVGEKYARDIEYFGYKFDE